jgi:hypothetical protein
VKGSGNGAASDQWCERGACRRTDLAWAANKIWRNISLDNLERLALALGVQAYILLMP